MLPDAIPRTARIKSAVVFALLTGLCLGTLLVGSLAWLLLSRTSGRTLLGRIWTAATGRTLNIDVSQPTVVDRRVYSRQTGLLVPSDPNLETQVREEAERQLRDAALADGILQTAQRNAESTITSLLQGLGFEKIELH